MLEMGKIIWLILLLLNIGLSCKSSIELKSGNNYSILYQKSVVSVQEYLVTMFSKNRQEIKSIIIADTLYTLKDIDTLKVGDKSFYNLKILETDSLANSFSTNYKLSEYETDSNNEMMQFEWNNPLVDLKTFQSFNISKIIDLGGQYNEIKVTLSSLYKQKNSTLLLAKVYLDDIFFVDDFFIFISIEETANNEYRISNIYDQYGFN